MIRIVLYSVLVNLFVWFDILHFIAAFLIAFDAKSLSWSLNSVHYHSVVSQRLNISYSDGVPRLCLGPFLQVSVSKVSGLVSVSFSKVTGLGHKPVVFKLELLQGYGWGKLLKFNEFLSVVFAG